MNDQNRVTYWWSRAIGAEAKLKPQKISTKEELAALPVGAVVRTIPDPGMYAYVCEKLSDGWYTILHEEQVYPLLPALVIYIPEGTQ
jgi:hypothetical protein